MEKRRDRRTNKEKIQDSGQERTEANRKGKNEVTMLESMGKSESQTSPAVPQTILFFCRPPAWTTQQSSLLEAV